MTHGAPDYYMYQLAGVRDVMSDMAELAARQDARDVYDRRGQVIWWDRFLSGKSPYTIAGAGTGNAVSVSADGPEWAGYCLSLTAGSDGAAQSNIARKFAPAELNKWGLEVGVWFLTEFNCFDLRLPRFDGAQGVWPWLRIDRLHNEISVRSVTGDFYKLADLPNPVDAYGMYHQVKLVADLEWNLYTRVLYDDLELDASGYAPWFEPDPDLPHQRLQVYLYGRTGYNDSCRIGHLILTTGEP